ncbi:uncharacterized protein ISCGN_032001 [Ixodes scapularis]
MSKRQKKRRPAARTVPSQDAPVPPLDNTPQLQACSGRSTPREPQDYTERDEQPGSHLVSVKSELDGSSELNAMATVTVKTEPQDYTERDEEPGSHLVSVKPEPDYYDEYQEPISPVLPLTKDYTDVTMVTFHLDTEPQASEENLDCDNAAVTEPQDPTEVNAEAVFAGTEPQDPREVNAEAASMETGLAGSSEDNAMATVTFKTEPQDYTERDEEPRSHLVSVKSEPDYHEEYREPMSPVLPLTKGTLLTTFFFVALRRVIGDQANSCAAPRSTKQKLVLQKSQALASITTSAHFTNSFIHLFATLAKRTPPSGKTGNQPEQVAWCPSASLVAFADTCCRPGGGHCNLTIEGPETSQVSLSVC